MKFTKLVILFVLCLSVASQVMADIGYTRDQMSMKYGKQISRSGGTEFGKEVGYRSYSDPFGWVSDLAPYLSVQATFMGDRVVYVRYSANYIVEFKGRSERFDRDRVLAYMLAKAGLTGGWERYDFKETKSNQTSYLRHKSGAQMTVDVSNRGGMAILLSSAEWVKARKEYEALPLYKRLLR